MSDSLHTVHDIPVDDSMGSHTSTLTADATGDVLSDYNVGNLLFVYSTGQPTDDVRSDFDQAQANLQGWQAWEAATVEEAVKSKIKSHDLPGDGSWLSVLKRNNYRVKVLQAYRARATWIVDASADNGTKTLSTLNKDAATVIVQHLASVLPVQFQDVKLVLAPSIRSLIQNSTDGQSCTLTCAHNALDDVASRIRTTVWELTIDIVVQSKGGKMTDAIVKHAVTSSNFVHGQWTQQSKMIKQPTIDTGMEIVPSFTLHLAEYS